MPTTKRLLPAAIIAATASLALVPTAGAATYCAGIPAGCDNGAQITAAIDVLFQSTHPRGVRPGETPEVHRVRRFQSTHPRGVRQWIAGPVGRVARFNPRTRAGCDQAGSRSGPV